MASSTDGNATDPASPRDAVVSVSSDSTARTVGDTTDEDKDGEGSRDDDSFLAIITDSEAATPLCEAASTSSCPVSVVDSVFVDVEAS